MKKVISLFFALAFCFCAASCKNATVGSETGLGTDTATDSVTTSKGYAKGDINGVPFQNTASRVSIAPMAQKSWYALYDLELNQQVEAFSSRNTYASIPILWKDGQVYLIFNHTPLDYCRYDGPDSIPVDENKEYYSLYDDDKLLVSYNVLCETEYLIWCVDEQEMYAYDYAPLVALSCDGEKVGRYVSTSYYDKNRQYVESYQIYEYTISSSIFLQIKSWCQLT
jgi:hypothetical protein